MFHEIDIGDLVVPQTRIFDHPNGKSYLKPDNTYRVIQVGGVSGMGIKLETLDGVAVSNHVIFWNRRFFDLVERKKPTTTFVLNDAD